MSNKMTVAPGDKFGRYEILGPIGAGRMSGVWRARDTEPGNFPGWEKTHQW